MNEVVIFYGSKSEFEKIIPKEEVKNLTQMVMELDAESKLYYVVPRDNPSIEYPRISVKNFVIESTEYSGVREHVILNFINFFSKVDIENIYIQNPPLCVSEQIIKLYAQTKIKSQNYKKITTKILRKLNLEYSKQIKGQESAKDELLQALYPLVSNKHKKPVVILFYGDTGVGKTESANYLSQLLGETLFRKQFSMFHNNQFATYLFGGTHFEMSFAKDLLDRESNVILIDEFDKANTTFHSAFYQLFDEGIYTDQNYHVELSSSIIICTSNYKSTAEIKNHLGNAIFSRFDKVIKFRALTSIAKKEIAEMQYDKYFKDCSSKEQKIITEKNIKDRVFVKCLDCDNARQISHLIKDTFSLILLESLLDDNA